jgi:hypothetical protein
VVRPGVDLRIIHRLPWDSPSSVDAELVNEIDVWQPPHVVSLAHTGLAFGEMFDLDTLSADCKADGICEFMFPASPLPLTGASGSPVSALAIR